MTVCGDVSKVGSLKQGGRLPNCPANMPYLMKAEIKSTRYRQHRNGSVLIKAILAYLQGYLPWYWSLLVLLKYCRFASFQRTESFNALNNVSSNLRINFWYRGFFGFFFNIFLLSVTVHLKDWGCGSCFVMLRLGTGQFTHILQGCFTYICDYYTLYYSSPILYRLSKCYWDKPD